MGIIESESRKKTPRKRKWSLNVWHLQVGPHILNVSLGKRKGVEKMFTGSRPSASQTGTLSALRWWFWLSVDTSGINSNPERLCTPVRDFCLTESLKWWGPLLIQFWGGKTPLIRIFWGEKTHLQATPSTGSLYKGHGRRKPLLFACLVLLASLFLHWR